MPATLTVNKAHTRNLTGMRLVEGTISLAVGYLTNGEPISLSLNEVRGMVIENKAGYIFEYDRTNKKLKAFRFDYAAGAAGPAAEVPNATDLSALADIAFLAWGW